MKFLRSTPRYRKPAKDKTTLVGLLSRSIARKDPQKPPSINLSRSLFPIQHSSRN